jgi:hypothetical protein
MEFRLWLANSKLGLNSPVCFLLRLSMRDLRGPSTTTLNIAVVTPMPSASVNPANAVKPGFRARLRNPIPHSTGRSIPATKLPPLELHRVLKRQVRVFYGLEARFVRRRILTKYTFALWR